RVGGIAGQRARVRGVRVRRHLLGGERDRLDSGLLADRAIAEPGPLPGTDRRTPAEVGEREGGDAVPAELRAEQREERRVLREREVLAVGGRPAVRAEVVAGEHQLADERRVAGARTERGERAAEQDEQQ